MADVVHDAQHEFWRPPVVAAEAARAGMVEVCDGCATEFMVGSLFCYACGAAREARTSAAAHWTIYLQFHNIKRTLGLSIASLVAFVVGMLTYELLAARPLVAMLAGLLAAAFVAVLAQSLAPRPDASAALAAYADGRLLAEASWTAYVRSSFHQNGVLFALAKVPTFAGVAFGIVLALRAAFAQVPLRTAA